MPHFYASGGVPASDEYRDRIERTTTNRLLSLHKSYLGQGRKWLNEVQAIRDTSDMNIMFDSGAFTAWTKHEAQPSVDALLRVYTSALRYCEGRFKQVWFISLDVLPGKKGEPVTEEQLLSATKQSDVSHHILAKEFGNRVLPVFHQTEPVSRLNEVMSLNPEYICLSPRQGGDFVDEVRRGWVQRVHAYVGKGISTHGLAATGGKIMTEAPWHSVDSATWLLWSAYGKIMLASGNDFKIIGASEHSNDRRIWNRHIDTAPPEVIRKVDAIRDRIKVTMDELRMKHNARVLFNLTSIIDMTTVDRTDIPFPQTLFAP